MEKKDKRERKQRGASSPPDVYDDNNTVPCCPMCPHVPLRCSACTGANCSCVEQQPEASFTARSLLLLSACLQCGQMEPWARV
jgi:hypothetical protein